MADADWPARVGWTFIYERIIKRPHPWPLPPDGFTLAEVRTDRIKSMEAPDEGVVAEYEAAGSASMPPIVLAASLSVIDGSHRLAAARRRGDETVLAYVMDTRPAAGG